MDSKPDPAKTLSSRQKFATDFNPRMKIIWADRLKKLKIRRTGALANSVHNSSSFRHDRQFLTLDYRFTFLEYGLYVDRGTGRGVYRGNSGDIGRENRRPRNRRWMNPKFYMSMCNMRDFMAHSIGLQFIHIFDEIDARPASF